jgi:hypothetical protein
MIYINGIKASKKALKLLTEYIKKKRIAVELSTTKSGNLSINTFDL